MTQVRPEIQPRQHEEMITGTIATDVHFSGGTQNV